MAEHGWYAVVFFAVLAVTDIAVAEEFAAGGFRFSDELGGFRILSATGTGTTVDPVVLEEDFFDVAPVTLIIRRDRLAADQPEMVRSLALVKIVHNRTRRIWAGYEMELQEIRDKPSVYGDGLSFNQMDVRPPDVTSDRFSSNNRQFEPYDRIRFETGSVDPEKTARFSVLITDPTPVPEFYLVQDPQILFARRDDLPGIRFARRPVPVSDPWLWSR